MPRKYLPLKPIGQGVVENQSTDIGITVDPKIKTALCIVNVIKINKNLG
jgi:hypothetical protein